MSNLQWKQLESEDAQVQAFYELFKEFIEKVIDHAKEQQGINFRYPKWAVQVVFVMVIVAVTLLVM